MKILCIGDFHGKFPASLKKIAKTCDFILCTGDFGGSEELSRFIFRHWDKALTPKEEKQLEALEKRDKQKGRKVIQQLNRLELTSYVVMGNHDVMHEKKALSYPEWVEKLKNLHYLQNKTIKKKGVKIIGYGGFVVSDLYLTKESGFSEKRRKKYKKHYDKEKKQIMKKGTCDIFLAHYPAFGHFDVIQGKKNPLKGKHVGHKPYLEYIKKKQPAFFICGHMHEYQGLEKVGNTQIIATGAAYEGKAAVIDWDTKKVTLIS